MSASQCSTPSLKRAASPSVDLSVKQPCSASRLGSPAGHDNATGDRVLPAALHGAGHRAGQDKVLSLRTYRGRLYVSDRGPDMLQASAAGGAR